MKYSDLPPELTVDIEGPLRIVTLNRPNEKNAINLAMHRALAEIWRMLADDLDARAILLRGEGPLFSAGGDYEFFRETLASEQLAAESFRHGQRIIDDIVRLPIPLVTAIRGAAVGLAASIGVLSDLVVMSEDGFYRDTHVPLGLVPGDGGIAVWPNTVPLQIAKEFLFFGDKLPARRAAELGMVNRVVPSEEVDAVARQLAERLCGLPREALSATKRAINLHLERDIRGIAEFGLAAEQLNHQSSAFRKIADNLGRRAS